MHKKPSSSWENSHQWYNEAVGASGHYYHEHLILPGLLRLLKLSPTASVLDVACGQGVLARSIPPVARYVGLDISQSLIQSAKKFKSPNHFSFTVHDATKPFPEGLGVFSHAAIVLALQNIESPIDVLKHIHAHLGPKGKLAIVLNHPSFRIPRQSGWIIDPSKKLQSRRVDRYMSALNIPIATHPSQKDASSSTLSFHTPLSFFFKILKETGFHVLELEEWCSDKKSSGKMSTMEDRAREEFPLFLTLIAEKS